MPIVRAVDQFVRDARMAKASGGPALPIVQRVALAVDAAVREIMPARLDATAQPATVEGSVAFPAVIVGSGGLALPRVGIAVQGTVRDRRSVTAGQVLVLVVVWLLVLVMPVAIADTNLSPETQQTLDAYYGAVAALAAGLTFYILDKRR